MGFLAGEWDGFFAAEYRKLSLVTRYKRLSGASGTALDCTDVELATKERAR
jgi:hypothetical protein